MEVPGGPNNNADSGFFLTGVLRNRSAFSPVNDPNVRTIVPDPPNPIFASFMRTPAQPDAWRHAVNWFLPVNLLRGALIGLVFCPLLGTIRTWSFRQRFLMIAGLYLVP